MRYDAQYTNGLAGMSLVRALTTIAEHFGTNYPIARSIMTACREAYAQGSRGEDYQRPIATRDLADLVHDAWIDGIQRKERITVRLVSSELQCQECGCSYLDCNDTVCPKGCDPSAIGRNVTAYAEGPYAHEWADWDGYIAGSSWETPSDMPGTAYACPCDHPGLVAELRAEGYKLDLSDYEDPS